MKFQKNLKKLNMKENKNMNCETCRHLDPDTGICEVLGVKVLKPNEGTCEDYDERN